MRLLLILLITLSTLHCQIPATYGAQFNINKTTIKDLFQAYGYIIGQDYSLERIQKEYPELSGGVEIARAQFHAAFPKIKSKFEEHLLSILDEESFEIYRSQLKGQINKTIAKQTITKNDAQDFLRQIQERAKSNIHSPIIEYFLSIQYLNNPVGEFFDNYRQRFRSDGHPKAQGIDLVLQVPKSWKAKDGERPHIVQKWISQNGTGSGMMLLDIRDMQGYSMSNGEVVEMVNSGEIKDVIPEGFSYINSGLFTLEKRKGYWIEMNMTQERAGFEIYNHTIMNQLFFRGKAIGVMCSVLKPKDEKVEADQQFEEIRPLCQQVLNSLVLLQTY